MKPIYETENMRIYSNGKVYLYDTMGALWDREDVDLSLLYAALELVMEGTDAKT